MTVRAGWANNLLKLEEKARGSFSSHLAIKAGVSWCVVAGTGRRRAAGSRGGCL